MTENSRPVLLWILTSCCWDCLEWADWGGDLMGVSLLMVQGTPSNAPGTGMGALHPVQLFAPAQ